MVVAKNVMEIFAELDKSNCKLCGEKTCLAFAGAVFTGTRSIVQCPKVTPEVIRRFSDSGSVENLADEIQEKYLESLIEEAKRLDFDETAARIGGKCNNNQITLKVLGKSFGFSKDGRFLTDLHVIPWVVIPVLEYMCHCKGEPLLGEWISYREIPDGREKYNLFKKRGEDVLKSLGDTYPGFFSDIVQMFDGSRVPDQFESDVSVVLYPLPKIPLMLCYWGAEDGMESKLNLYFDRSVGENLGADMLFYLGTGIAQMLEKLAQHHGF